MIIWNELGKDIKAQCLQSLIEMVTADGDLDFEDQDHLKYVILKIKIRPRCSSCPSLAVTTADLVGAIKCTGAPAQGGPEASH